MTNFDDRRKTRRATNAQLEQMRENKPAWLYTKQAENEILALVIDLGLHGCSFILPKDYQITLSELTLAVLDTNNSPLLPTTHPFQLVWIDEHFSRTEQKFGVHFNNIDSAEEKTLQRTMAILESEKAHQVRCTLKVKEEIGFF